LRVRQGAPVSAIAVAGPSATGLGERTAPPVCRLTCSLPWWCSSAAGPTQPSARSFSTSPTNSAASAASTTSSTSSSSGRMREHPTAGFLLAAAAAALGDRGARATRVHAELRQGSLYFIASVMGSSDYLNSFGTTEFRFSELGAFRSFWYLRLGVRRYTRKVLQFACNDIGSPVEPELSRMLAKCLDTRANASTRRVRAPSRLYRATRSARSSRWPVLQCAREHQGATSACATFAAARHTALISTILPRRAALDSFQPLGAG